MLSAFFFHVKLSALSGIAGHPFELTMGKKPRKIHIGGHECEIQADKRELLIDGKCYYKIGEPIRDWYLKGEKHTIFYQGAPANFWLDDMQVLALL